MSPKDNQLARVLEAIESLRQEVAVLGDRVAAIEAASAATAARAAVAVETIAAAPASVPVDGELAMAIGAAIAAYLGKRPHIRQIRLLGSSAWAQQGRVSVQGSYSVSVNPR
jgi:methylmalonyl-CoA carboxyltransferase 12S subunit